MRKIFIVLIAALPPMAALAEPSGRKKSDQAPASSGKPLPLKGATRTNSCAEFGPGFVRIEGSDTCMKIGGGIGIGGGVSRGGR
jgi:hypothetical protein